MYRSVYRLFCWFNISRFYIIVELYSLHVVCHHIKFVMSMQSESSEQPSCGVPEGHQPIFDVANRDPMVPLPTPVHGDVRNPLVPWHLLCPIEPLPLQENILQAAMQLAEPHFLFCLWSNHWSGRRLLCSWQRWYVIAMWKVVVFHFVHLVLLRMPVMNLIL